MSDLINKNRAGWDIGGAHLKLALYSENQMQVFQWPCPLWRGLQELVSCLTLAFRKIPEDAWVHHVTMTGELVDIFEDRHVGVAKIVDTFQRIMPSGHQLRIFAGDNLLTTNELIANTQQVASANWLASGRLLSRYRENTLFIDVGSTTTDLLLIRNGEPGNSGYSDAERLRTGELVYTGVVRSCVNTICKAIPFHGEQVPLMAENFSVSADVYRILETLPAHADSGDTMDGQAKDKIASMRRLARMIGEDFRDVDVGEWERAADYISSQQRKMITVQASRFLERLGGEKSIVAAGVGRFLIQQIAREMGVQYSDFAETVLPESAGYDCYVADCAPAVSLALY